MTTWNIYNEDIVAWAQRYDGPLYHAFISDMPYHLTEIVKRFGKANSAPAQHGNDGAFGRVSKGFMGQTWDGGDLAFRAETWEAIMPTLHPGAFGLAFAGSRGWHRMAVAIEDAGFIIHPTIFGWAYGSGLPKATRIDIQADAQAFRAWLKERPEQQTKLIELKRAARQDKIQAKAIADAFERGLKEEAGLLPRVIEVRKHAPKFDAKGHGYREKDNGYNSRERQSFELTEAATELGRAWAGHRYGLQAVKPALEPIILFQKPYGPRPIHDILTTGAGALNISATRLPNHQQPHERDGEASAQRRYDATGNTNFAMAPGPRNGDPAGRWPANLVLTHTWRCDEYGCADDCPVRLLGEQSGELTSGIGAVGTAARFFHTSDWQYEIEEQLALAQAVRYVAKPSRAEREAGLDPKQTAIMRLLDDSEDAETFGELTIDDGRPTPIDNQFQRGKTQRRNPHPTIKPIGLTRWLASLLLPPAYEAYLPRRLLVGCSGVGSEMIGGLLAGWDQIDGVEITPEYVPVAEARLTYWQQRRYELLDPARPLKVRAAPKMPVGQIDMFGGQE